MRTAPTSSAGRSGPGAPTRASSSARSPSSTTGDKGKRDRGELRFNSYRADFEHQGCEGKFRKRNTGDRVATRSKDFPKGKVLLVTPANEGAPIHMSVQAEECDRLRTRFCAREVLPGNGSSGPVRAHSKETGGRSGRIQWAIAGTKLRPKQILATKRGALPPWHGTPVRPPKGHDGYVMFHAIENHVRFRVFATVDFALA
jgi:hypothetical protein